MPNFITTAEQYEKIKKYASDLKQSFRGLNETLQEIENNLKWAEAHIPMAIDSIEQLTFDDDLIMYQTQQ